MFLFDSVSQTQSVIYPYSACAKYAPSFSLKIMVQSYMIFFVFKWVCMLNYIKIVRSGEHFSQIDYWHPNWFVLLFTVRLSVVLMRTYSSNYQWGREGTGFIKRWVLLYYWYYWCMRGNLNFFVSVLVRKVDKMAFLTKALTAHVLHLRSPLMLWKIFTKVSHPNK